MPFASVTIIGIALPIVSGIFGGVVGLWIGAKLPSFFIVWLRGRVERTANSTEDPETAAIRKRAHEIARKLYPKLVR